MQKNKLRWIVVAVLGGMISLSPMVRAADATPETKAEVKTEQKVETKTEAGATTAKPKRVDRLQHLAKALTLTEDQKAKVKTILADQTTKNKELREKNAEKKEIAKLRTETDAKIRGLLTTEQQAKFDKLNARPEAKAHKKKAEKATEKSADKAAE
jgi:Spy/CpxP family protein refolding chaperone